MEVTPSSPPDRPRVAPQKDPQKSRVSNGSALMPGVDQRGPWIRRCKDIIAEYLSDIPDASTAERSIIRRVATLTVELEMLEAQFATVGQADPTTLDLYVRASGNLKRLLEAIGLQRRAKDALTLDQYCAEHYRGDNDAAA